MTDAGPGRSASEAPIRVLGGSPTDEESAAIAALVTGLLLDRSASALPLPAHPTRTTWARTRGSLRTSWPAEQVWRDR